MCIRLHNFVCWVSRLTMKKFLTILIVLTLMSCNRFFNACIEGDHMIYGEHTKTKVIHYPKRKLTKIKVVNKPIENEKEEINASHILLKIEMGPNTNDALKRKSTLFSYDASDPKIGFYAALDSHQVSLKKVENIVNGATSLQSYGALREAVRFAYSSEVNEVSDHMQNDRYFIVANLDSVLSEGTKSFEEVQNQIKSTMTQERGFTEAEQLAEKLRKELSKGSSFQQLKDNNENIDLITGDSKLLIRSFQSIGKSNYFVGALANAVKGDIIGPLKTPRGYGIVTIVDISPIDSMDFEMKRDVISVSYTHLTLPTNREV